MTKRIVVLQRGWVAIGDLTVTAEGHAGAGCKLENASIIRKWGTTKGLGQLALEGPTKDTVLDPSGTLVFNENAVVVMFEVNAAKWQ